MKELPIVSSIEKPFKNINQTKKVKKLKKRLRRLQRKGSRKYLKNKKGECYCKTNNIIKTEKKIKKVHRTLDNIRTDYRQKITTEIAKTKPSRVVMESLNVVGMMKSKHFSKAIEEQGFYDFYAKMKYKAKRMGIEFVEAVKWYPSSKRCSCCGNVKPKRSLSERTYKCESCGLEIDRDKNASINLSRVQVFFCNLIIEFYKFCVTGIRVLYIGIMSGTSLDGIDAVIVDFLDNHRLKVVGKLSLSFEDGLREDIINLLSNFQITLEKLGEIDHRLGKAYAESVLKLCKQSNVLSSEIIAIGCHGQTVYHQPVGRYPFTMQLGDGNIIAAETKIAVCNDFRRLDMAFQGQGAPLTPIFHHAFFKSSLEDRVILNLGGIANSTFLYKDNSEVIGFDHGPANVLLDSWIMKHLQCRYDKEGEWAKGGKVNTQLLSLFLEEPYFKKLPPKSTGRELFNLEWLEKHLVEFSFEARDVQATLVELSVLVISKEIRLLMPNISTIFLCGGGAYNNYFISRLQHYLPKVKITSTLDVGIEPQWVEAIAFAWFAKQRIEREVGNLPSVTGAISEAVLGALYESMPRKIKKVNG